MRLTREFSSLTLLSMTGKLAVRLLREILLLERSLNRHETQHHGALLPHPCAHCELGYRLLPALARHVREAHPDAEAVDVEGRVSARESLIVARSHLFPQFSCRFCDATFSDSKNRNAHQQRAHWSLMPHRCAACRLGFDLEGAKNRHMREKHEQRVGKVRERGLSQVVSLSCRFGSAPIASWSSSRRADRDMHRQRFHPSSLPFACNRCELGFALKGALIRHKRDVHGVKPKREVSGAYARYSRCSSISAVLL